MKTLVTIGGIAVILCIGIGTALWFFRASTVTYEVTPEVTPLPATSAPTPEVLSGRDTLQNIFALKKTLECSFRMVDATPASEGTAFFANGKMRVDTMYQGTSTQIDTASFIASGETLYSWADTSGGSFAVVMPASDLSSAPRAARSGEVSLSAQIQYDCKPWNVDGSVFVPPANIQFLDLRDLSKAVPQSKTLP